MRGAGGGGTDAQGLSPGRNPGQQRREIHVQPDWMIQARADIGDQAVLALMGGDFDRAILGGETGIDRAKPLQAVRLARSEGRLQGVPVDTGDRTVIVAARGRRRRQGALHHDVRTSGGMQVQGVHRGFKGADDHARLGGIFVRAVQIPVLVANLEGRHDVRVAAKHQRGEQLQLAGIGAEGL